MDSTEQILKDHIKQLPPEFVRALDTVDFVGGIRTVADQHTLNTAQSATLEEETVFVLLRLKDSMDYSQTLQKELNISDERVISIISDLNKYVFGPVRNNLQDQGVIEKNIPMPPSAVPPPPDTTQKSSLLKDRASKIMQSGTRKRQIKEGEEDKTKPYSGEDPYREKIDE